MEKRKLNPKESEKVSFARTVELLTWFSKRFPWIYSFDYEKEKGWANLTVEGFRKNHFGNPYIHNIKAIVRFYPMRYKPTSVHLTTKETYQPEDISLNFLKRILGTYYSDIWIILTTGDVPTAPKYVIADKVTNFPIERFGLSSTATGRNELTLNFGQERWVSSEYEGLFGHTWIDELEKIRE